MRLEHNSVLLMMNQNSNTHVFLLLLIIKGKSLLLARRDHLGRKKIHSPSMLTHYFSVKYFGIHSSSRLLIFFSCMDPLTDFILCME